MAAPVVSIIDDDDDIVVMELVQPPPMKKAAPAPLPPPPPPPPPLTGKRKREDGDKDGDDLGGLSYDAIMRKIDKFGKLMATVVAGDGDLTTDQREAVKCAVQSQFKASLQCSVCLGSYEDSKDGAGGVAGAAGGYIAPAAPRGGRGGRGGGAAAAAARGRGVHPAMADSDMAATVCGHIFHSGCIAQCIAATHKCPLCNTSLKPRGDVNPLYF